MHALIAPTRSKIEEVAFPLAGTTESDAPCSLLAAQPARQAIPFLRLWHLASLDAPTVAVVWACAIAWAAGVHLESWVLCMLACGTWSVYAGDRLLDTHRALRASNLDALRERHYFHWRHRRTLIPLALCSAAITATVILLRMPATVRAHNSILAVATVAYFSGVHSAAKLPSWLRRIASKEFLVGSLFTAGCAAPTFSRLHWQAPWTFFLCAAFLAAVAWLNCRAIDRWESQSIPTGISRRAGLLCTLGFAAAITIASAHPRSAMLLGAASTSALLLALLDRMRDRFTPLALRALADFVLLTPALLLAWGTHTA